jgi:two-component system cell cycle response regulator DivK
MSTFTEPGAAPVDAAKIVLVVEDNTLNMKLFSAMLASQGYVVIEANDGPSGLAMAQQRLPDLIIMDIQLPGMSGLDVTNTLKNGEATKHIPIIATTAFALRGDEERFLGSGCDGYMAKPIAITEFLVLVDSFMKRARPATEFQPSAA